jgi:hypothetical protein
MNVTFVWTGINKNQLANYVGSTVSNLPSIAVDPFVTVTIDIPENQLATWRDGMAEQSFEQVNPPVS